MKKLTQEIFKGQPQHYVSAAINANGYSRLWSVPKSHLKPDGRDFISKSIHSEVVYSRPLGDGFDATNWQNSAINKDF